MQLVLPKNFVAITAEEMMYLDGGWTWNNFSNNLHGAWNRSAPMRNALTMIRISNGVALTRAGTLTMRALAQGAAGTKFAAALKIGVAVLAPPLALAATVGGIALVREMGRRRVF